MLARSLGETLGDEGLEVAEVHGTLHRRRAQLDDGGVIHLDALDLLAHDRGRALEGLGAFGLGGVSGDLRGLDHLGDQRAALEDEAEGLVLRGLDAGDLLAALAGLGLHALASGRRDESGGLEELRRLHRLVLGGGGVLVGGGLAHGVVVFGFGCASA